VARFSIVLPVYNVRAYLRECLDSILGQSFADFELIAVDDSSPDHSGEILDEYAARDGRVQVVHLAENVGLGRARNAGMQRATGDYLLFVDSDDAMVPGALQAISARLTATGDPDILIFDYARLYWNRQAVRNRLAHLLRGGPEVFTIDARPELLSLLMVVWNKAFRRDFITAGGFQFPPGYYEDTPWTYPTLLAAQRIATLDRVCLQYRMRREAGNILKSRSRKHFEIFDQWERVFGWLDGHPEHARWRAYLLRRELEHVVTILDNPARLPVEARSEFFARGHQDYLRYRTEEALPLPEGRLGRRIQLICDGRYLRFRLQTRAGRVAASWRGRARRGRAGARAQYRRGVRLAKRFYYRTQLLFPIDENLALFSAYWDRGVSCNPAAIYYKAREIAPQVRGVFVIRDPRATVIPDGVEWVLTDSIAHRRVAARAKFFVNNANFPDWVRKRPGTVHLQTQHGTPLKKMGLDLQDFPVGANRMNFERLLRRVDRWDFNISSNRFSTEVWERCYPASFETLEVGYPRNDRLVRATDADRERVRGELGIAPDATVVLFAPTFRDYQRVFSPEIDFAQLVEAIGDNGVLLVRAHYFLDDEAGEMHALSASRRVLDVSDHPCVEDLCIAADVLLTDYSSIMFDYAVLDRPIVIYAYDWDTYVRTRGVNHDLVAEPPGVVARSAAELLEAFRSGEVSSERAAKARAEFRRRFCEFDDGSASEKVVRRVFLGERLAAGTESGSTAVATMAERDEDEIDPNVVDAGDGDSGPPANETEET
jgi:CDP-glycerol glycerophosphotransferase (TagB/SpsB family)/glycosyltransferase involved in cell wall biosynthesis